MPSVIPPASPGESDALRSNSLQYPQPIHLVPQDGGAVDDGAAEVEVGVDIQEDVGAGELRLELAVAVCSVRAVGAVRSQTEARHQLVLQTEGRRHHVLRVPLRGQLSSSPGAPLGLDLEAGTHPASVNVGLTFRRDTQPRLRPALHLQLHQAKMEAFTWSTFLATIYCENH